MIFGGHRPEVAVQIDGAAGGKEWELVLDLFLNLSAPRIEDRLQPVFETELAVLLADEVDDGETALVARSAQPSNRSPSRSIGPRSTSMS